MFSPHPAGGSGTGAGGTMPQSLVMHSVRSGHSGSRLSFGDSAMCLSAVLTDGGQSWANKGTTASLNDASADDTGYGGLVDCPEDDPMAPAPGPRPHPTIGHGDSQALVAYLDASACGHLHSHGAEDVCPHQLDPWYASQQAVPEGEQIEGEARSDVTPGEQELDNSSTATRQALTAGLSSSEPSEEEMTSVRRLRAAAEPLLTKPPDVGKRLPDCSDARAQRRRLFQKHARASRSQRHAFSVYDSLPHTALFNPRQYAPSAVSWGWGGARDPLPAPPARAVVLLMCLNVGTDPPGVDRTHPPGLQCWQPPSSFGDKQKAAKEITALLQRQYVHVLRMQAARFMGPREPRAQDPAGTEAEAEESYTFTSFPDAAYEDLSRLSFVRDEPSAQPPAGRGGFMGQPGFGGTKQRRVVVHYNGHGVPCPSPHGELWVFNKQFTKYMPVRATELIHWVGVPALYILDARRAGVWVSHVRKDLSQHLREGDVLALAASDVRDLPTNPHFPADLLTAVLTTPMKMAVLWHSYRHPVSYPQQVVHRVLEALDSGAELFEGLTRTYDAIADAIGFDVLSQDLYVRLYQTDPLIAALYRNFLLAQRVLHGLGGDPTSYPLIPLATNHPLWNAFDWQMDVFLSGFLSSAPSSSPPPATGGSAMQTLLNDLGGGHGASATPRGLSTVAPIPRVYDCPWASRNPNGASPNAQADAFLENALREFELWLHSSSPDATPPATGHATWSPLAWLCGQDNAAKPPPVSLPLVVYALEVRAHQATCLQMLCEFIDRHGAEAISALLACGLFPRLVRITDEAEATLGVWGRERAADEGSDLCAEEALSHIVAAAPHLPAALYLWMKVVALNDAFVASQVGAHAGFFLVLLLRLSPAGAGTDVPAYRQRRSSGPAGFFLAQQKQPDAARHDSSEEVASAASSGVKPGKMTRVGGRLQCSDESLQSLMSPEPSSRLREAVDAMPQSQPASCIVGEAECGRGDDSPAAEAAVVRKRLPRQDGTVDNDALFAVHPLRSGTVVGVKTMLASALMYMCRHSREGRIKVAGRLVGAFRALVSPCISDLAPHEDQDDDSHGADEDALAAREASATAFVHWMLLLLSCILEADPAQLTLLGTSDLHSVDSWVSRCTAARSPLIRAAAVHLLPLSIRWRTTDATDVHLMKLLASACRDNSPWVRLACAHSLCNAVGLVSAHEESETTPSSEDKAEEHDCDHLLISIASSAAASLQNDPIKMIAVTAGNAMAMLRSNTALHPAVQPSPAERQLSVGSAWMSLSVSATRSPVSPSLRGSRDGFEGRERVASTDLSALGEEEGLEAVNEALAHGPQEMIKRSPLSTEALSTIGHDAPRELTAGNFTREQAPPVVGEEVMLASVTRPTLVEAALFMTQQKHEPTSDKAMRLHWRSRYVDGVTRRCLAECDAGISVRGKLNVIATYERPGGGEKAPDVVTTAARALAVHPTSPLVCWGSKSSVRVWDWTRNTSFQSYWVPPSAGSIVHLEILARYPVSPLLTCSARGMVYVHCDWVKLQSASVVTAFRLTDVCDFDVVSSFGYRAAELWGSAEVGTVRIADLATERSSETVAVRDETQITAIAAPQVHNPASSTLVR
eukprot:TRINITY_DN5916_c0_g1_i1.p1 TRINITY_DN5916_c0_g1~~TRINITY_DN5916_c0_g1_i1.p1  ORF type:complete len:1603 (+),score=257.69 TRINITY_DN5916_c0_g1_i1:118-4926(+)